jgi:hypothetical protein
MPRKSKLSPEMRALYKTDPAEFFRRTGAKGGRQRNKKVTLLAASSGVTKKQVLAQWGRVGGIVGMESRWGKNHKKRRRSVADPKHKRRDRP